MSIQTLFKLRYSNYEDPHAAALTALITRSGFRDLTGVRLEHVLRTEGIGADQVDALIPLFANQQLEVVSTTSGLDPKNGPITEISYQRGMTDPETDSVLHLAEDLGLPQLQWVRLATRIQLKGVDEATATEIIMRFFFNKTVQTTIAPDEQWNTLIPQGQVGGVEELDVANVSLDEFAAMARERKVSLSPKQLAATQMFYWAEGRKARDAELQMIAAAWSDHCSHTTLRALGLFQAIKDSTARINHPLVVSAFYDNAGAMQFYGNWALCLKGETHISPASVATYGGIMTKHGGVIRDILGFGQGAWPWAGTTFMATCDPRMAWETVPAGALHPLIILLESITGTCDYTNPMGIPMAGWQYLQHPNNVKCFALGHSAGVIPLNRAQKGSPQPDDICLLIGGKTGIDGIHGATVSSGAMTSQTAEVDGTHVQIGMPIEERKFMEAIPVLRDADCIRAITDCGAAGLSSAVGEMAAETGVVVNLAWVSLKCASMAPWQIWISESQERMVLAIPPNKLVDTYAILDTYGVPRDIIGVFTDSKRCQVVYDDTVSQISWLTDGPTLQSSKVVVDLPYSFLDGEAPLPDIKVVEPAPIVRPEPQLSVPTNPRQWISLVRDHLGHYNIADQSVAGHQYDQTVQGNTIVPFQGGVDEDMPDELFVATPVPELPAGAGLSVAQNQLYGQIDPAGMGTHVTVQAVAKLVAAGFSPNDIILCGNLYTPRVTNNPEAAWRLEQLVKYGYAPAAEALGCPIITGKDSSSGSFETQDGSIIDAPLTVCMAAMGRIPNALKVIPKAFGSPGDQIYLFTPGLQRIDLGGSVFLDGQNQTGNALPTIDVSAIQEGFELYHALATHTRLTARSAVAEGGLIRRLFEMSLGNRLGCSIELPVGDPIHHLFGECSGSIVFTTRSGIIDPDWELLHDGTCHKLGIVTNTNTITVRDSGQQLFSTTLNDLKLRWSKTFTEVAA